MKNIPVFTAAGGTATLILREIPKCGRAYVILQTHTPGMECEQVSDCAAFCRMAGAIEIYVSTADGTQLDLPHSHDMLRLALERVKLLAPRQDILLQPLTADTEAFYIEHFNRRFSPIHNAAMTDHRSLQSASMNGSLQFLAYHDDRFIGLGSIRDNTLEAIATIEPGWGRNLAYALLAKTIGDPIELTVCSINTPALRLYHSIGFTQQEVVSRWYKIEK